MGEIEELGDDSDDITKGEKESKSKTEKIDFTKPCPKDFLPADAYENSDLNPSDNDSDIVEQEDMDFFENNCCNKSSSNENLTSKRVILFIMLFPMLVSGGYMIYEAIGIKIPPLFWQASIVILILIVLIPVAKNFGLPILQVAIICFAVFFLLPTYQVYKCSPIELRNDMIGTWFSLKTDQSTFLSKSYVSSKCLKNHYVSMPHYLSFIRLKINLKADITDIITKSHNNDNRAYLLMSKRSVKKKFHKLHLLLKGDTDIYEKLEKAFNMDAKQKDRYLLKFSGSIEALSSEDLFLKNEIEDSGLLVRPIVYHLESVQYTDRYVKLPNPTYEYQ